MTLEFSTGLLAMPWLLPAYFAVFFATTMIWRSWQVYRHTGINPVVLPTQDSALGYTGRAFKLTLLALAVYLCLDASGWQGVQAPHAFGPGLQLLAWLVLVVSLGAMVVAQRQMGASWRVGIDEQRRTPLVTSGLFRSSRNPIFLTMRLNLLGLVVLRPGAAALGIAAVGEVLMQIQVRLEEQHLRQTHGIDYAAYCSRVRRWL
ncbi:methyltransferase family protein [Polaromonas sp.]|uniref:methyltransferase family protein n=1 Tax=Polaromonas sp. TaxID=1869339 RepID=UPI003C8A3CA8